MKRFGIASFVALLAIGAQAQAPRTFVSSNGTDSGGCSRVAPCRTFAAAIAAVGEGGEVIVLDSAGYGPVTIGKSVSLIAPRGVYAGVTATAGNAIVVNGSPSTRVVLRGLTVVGAGADYGIETTAAASLVVDNCVVSGFTTVGIAFYSGSALTVTDSLVRESGIAVIGSVPDFAVATIQRSRFERNLVGMENGDNVMATVRDCVLTGNENNGIYAFNGAVDVKNCILTDNAYGVYANGPSIITVSDSMVADNRQCAFFVTSGSAVRSFGNNEVFGNQQTLDCGVVTPVALQ